MPEELIEIKLTPVEFMKIAPLICLFEKENEDNVWYTTHSIELRHYMETVGGDPAFQSGHIKFHKAKLPQWLSERIDNAAHDHDK